MPSGTISQTVFSTRKVIDRAFGPTKISPQQITGEYIAIAKDLLYLFLSTLASKGIALWAIQKQILPLYEAVQSVPLPLGVVDLLNCNLRTSTRLAGTYSASSGIAVNAFDGDLETLCTQSAPGGNITVQFPSTSQPTCFGFFPAAFGTWDIEIQISVDGITWIPAYTNHELDVSIGQWFWTDIEGIPQGKVLYARLQAGPATVLNVAEFVVQDVLQEIPLSKINRDDYANLPDKWFLGRPTQFWYDKQIDQPIITLWPAPSAPFTFNQLICYVQNYIQDVGSMTDSLAVPQRWFLAIVCELSRLLNLQIPEAKGDQTMLEIEASKQLATAWASETDSSPTYIRPRIWNYTR